MTETHQALDIPADIMAEGKSDAMAPTVYRTGGRKRAIAQFATMQAATDYVAELVAEGQANEFAVKLSQRRPIRKSYSRRGVWRESGVRQVNR
jgi:hypothetical protein